MKIVYGLLAAFCLWHADHAQAETVVFDFDSGSPALVTGQNVPFDQTSGGVTASFNYDFLAGKGFSVQSDSSTGFTLTQFSGFYLYPNASPPGPLFIQFSQPLDSINFTFATADFHQVEVTTIIQLTAFLDSTAMGTATAHGIYGPDTMPMGSLTFSTNTAFNRVVIGIQSGQPVGATSDFLVDNINISTAAATAVPEPASAPMIVVAGLLSVLLVPKIHPIRRLAVR